jgi:hypothetical protein
MQGQLRDWKRASDLLRCDADDLREYYTMCFNGDAEWSRVRRMAKTFKCPAANRRHTMKSQDGVEVACAGSLLVKVQSVSVKRYRFGILWGPNTVPSGDEERTCMQMNYQPVSVLTY